MPLWLMEHLSRELARLTRSDAKYRMTECRGPRSLYLHCCTEMSSIVQYHSAAAMSERGLARLGRFTWQREAFRFSVPDVVVVISQLQP